MNHVDRCMNTLSRNMKAQGTRPSCKEWLRGSGGDFYYHMYWRGPMKRVVRMAIFSFLHTQACGKLILWVEGDGRDKHGYYRGLMTLPKQRFEIRQVDLKFLACRWVELDQGCLYGGVACGDGNTAPAPPPPLDAGRQNLAPVSGAPGDWHHPGGVHPAAVQERRGERRPGLCEGPRGLLAHHHHVPLRRHIRASGPRLRAWGARSRPPWNVSHETSSECVCACVCCCF